MARVLYGNMVADARLGWWYRVFAERFGCVHQEQGFAGSAADAGAARPAGGSAIGLEAVERRRRNNSGLRGVRVARLTSSSTCSVCRRSTAASKCS